VKKNIITTREVKQYIIIREDLGMSNGKLAAQSCHASMKVFFDKFNPEGRMPWKNNGENEYKFSLFITQEERQWIEGRFTKIVKKVKNESQLLKAYEKANELGLNCSLIKDAGLTELQGENYTAIAIGPNYTDKCEPVVKKLRNL
jgi:PTH2 family peptidyl-tRNA hydrolase